MTAVDHPREPRDAILDIDDEPSKAGKVYASAVGRVGRILDAPMDSFASTINLRTTLANLVAEGHDVIEVFVRELAQSLGAPGADVDPAFCEHRDGIGMHRLGSAARADDVYRRA